MSICVQCHSTYSSRTASTTRYWLSHEPPRYGEMEYVFVGIEPLSGFKNEQLPIFRVHLKAGGVTTTYLVGAPMSDVLIASKRSMYGKVRIEEVVAVRHGGTDI